MDQFHIFYIEANLVCVIVFSILLFHNHFSIDRQEKRIKYGRALVMFKGSCKEKINAEKKKRQ